MVEVSANVFKNNHEHGLGLCIPSGEALRYAVSSQNVVRDFKMDKAGKLGIDQRNVVETETRTFSKDLPGWQSRRGEEVDLSGHSTETNFWCSKASGRLCRPLDIKVQSYNCRAVAESRGRR